MIAEPKFKLPRKGSLHGITEKRRVFWIEDEIHCKQRVKEKGTLKRIFFQKIRFEDNNEIQFRFTYYMLGVKPSARGKWVFGQYSLMIPGKLLALLLKEARKRRWKFV